MRRKRRAAVGLVLLTAAASSMGQDGAKPFPPEQIKQGEALYAKNCESCHGVGMLGGEWAIDLRTFPREERSRFVHSVTNGKNAMPPWGDILSQQDIAALWAYVTAGEARK